MKKGLLIILSLLGIAGSVCILSMFVYIPVITDGLDLYLELYPWLDTVFAANVGLTCIVYLILLGISIFMQSSLGTVAVKKPNGKLQFSKQSLESAIRYSYSEIDEIRFSKIRIRLSHNPDKIKIYVRLSLKDPNRLMDLTSTIQTNIETAIKASLGITVKSINLEVVEATKDDSVTDAKEKSARVV